MPAKKAASRKTESMNMSMIWGWVYALAMLVAGVAGGLTAAPSGAAATSVALPVPGFVTNMPILGWILAAVAIVLGLFYFDAEEIGQFGLRVLILLFLYAGLAFLGGPVGSFVTGFFGGWVFFLAPVVLAMALKFFWNRRVAPLF